MKGWIKKLGGRTAQTTTEYVLVISVIAIGVVAVTYDPMKNAMIDGTSGFDTSFKNGTQTGVFTASPPTNR
jgi:hypothetical protein